MLASEQEDLLAYSIKRGTTQFNMSLILKKAPIDIGWLSGKYQELSSLSRGFYLPIVYTYRYSKTQPPNT